ncbi:SCAN domain-containing protein 1 [Sorex araneus]|uniref:SCAN domain-containing protein 1 n=1 Tax=Sorex araneus TaxID=42254 RepID=UPI0024334DE9|nr:SCAN domain-containing protein 1 [Sorex araneus]
MAATPGSPSSPPPQDPEGAAPGPRPERDPEGALTVPGPPSPSAAPPEAIPPPPAAAAAVGAAPRPPPNPQSPAASRLGPETFRQRFRQFRYQDAAGPREAFRQLRELSRQWLRPDIRTKEQIVEMLVQEQLLAILPEAARARRPRRRTDVRITG